MSKQQKIPDYHGYIIIDRDRHDKFIDIYDLTASEYGAFLICLRLCHYFKYDPDDVGRLGSFETSTRTLARKFRLSNVGTFKILKRLHQKGVIKLTSLPWGTEIFIPDYVNLTTND